MDFFEAGIKAAAWPTHDPQLFYGIAKMHQRQADDLDEAAHTSYTTFRPRFAQALQGQAGDAQLASHDENVALWQQHAEQHRAAAAAASEVGREHEQLRYELGLLIDEGQPKYDQAVHHGEAGAAVQIYAGYRAEAVGMATEAAGRISGVLGTNPLAPPPDPGDRPGNNGKRDGKKNGDAKKDPQPSEAAGADTPDAKKDPQPVGVAPPSAPSAPSAPSTSTLAGAAPSSGGGGAAGSMGGGLPTNPVSGMRAPSAPSLGGGSMPSVPSVPAATTPASTTPPPAANLLPNLQAGFLQGETSAAPAAVPHYAQPPLSPLPVQQQIVSGGNLPPVAGPAAAGTVDAGPPVAAGGPAGGSVGGPAPMMSGAPMMTGQPPMSPYSVPGGNPSPGTAVPPGGATIAQSASAAGSGPLFAGTGGAVASAAAASAAEENPDLVKARRLLAELVHGTDASGVKAPIMWAVSVLHAASGPYTYVASSVGGGDYLPSRVYLPRSADLAVSDPRLPAGWADRFTACQRPSAVLAAHFEELRDHVLDLRVSAIATSETLAKRPLCGGSWEPLSMYEAQRLPGEAPELDGWHRHRLAVTDPGVWSRLQTIDRKAKADTAVVLAAAITETVLAAAAEPDDTGRPLAIAADEELWDRVKAGAVPDDDWQAWAEASEQARELAEGYAPPDEDESQATRTMQGWYTHWFRAARLVELLQCWDPRRPLSGVCDVVYTALAAGFPDVVAAAIADVERP